jgi:hypothetical protein
MMTKDAIIDLPPIPPAYVEDYEVISALRCDRRPSVESRRLRFGAARGAAA